jgi:hypothetical protein
LIISKNNLRSLAQFAQFAFKKTLPNPTGLKQKNPPPEIIKIPGDG